MGAEEVTLIQSDLLSAFDVDRFCPKVDILIFNPPYVPTTEDELMESQNDKLLSAAWAGGLDGRSVIDRFIENSNFHRLMADNGVFYLVTIAMNKPNEIIERLQQSPFNLRA